MKIAIIALTTGGKRLAEKINSFYAGALLDTRDAPVFEKMAGLWAAGYDAIICVMATGIVVRGLAPLCEDKKNDPCVLVLDEKGQFVISLLSGHLGGGNALALSLAARLGAQAVITTASDVTGHTALDLWARKNSLLVEEYHKLTSKSAKLVNGGSLTLYTDCDCESLPLDFHQVSDPMGADIIVSDRVFKGSEALILRPCTLAVGLGCNRGTSSYDFEVAVNELFRDARLNRASIRGYYSIDLKQDEQGLLDFVSSQGIPIAFYNKEQLNAVDGVSSSAAVLKATGAKGVAEPAALLGVSRPEAPGILIVRKRKWKDVTAAVATKRIRLVA